MSDPPQDKDESQPHLLEQTGARAPMPPAPVIVLTNATVVSPHDHSLPMLRRYPVLAGALAGLALRLLFSGNAGSDWSAMTGTFIVAAPVLVGMLTVYLAEKQYRRSWTYYFAAPMWATALFVLGSLLLLIEGLICAVVIVPMFACLGIVGGVLMGAICRLTDWPKATLYSVSAIPLLVLVLASAIPAPDRIGVIERSLRVNAPPAVVWSTLHDIQDIAPAEMADAYAQRIGVPMPLAGVTRLHAGQRIRQSLWGKHVHFEEVISDWRPQRYVRWTYRFAADSFPRAALDDHVVIGGHYFDLLDTSYSLLPLAGGQSTQLTTRTSYRISTQFNFYADWVAQLLIGNLSDVGLRLYRSRSELQHAQASPTAERDE